MIRVPGELSSATLGQKTMTRTIHCPQCGVPLNVPESAAGRKLKCPSCATKFAAPTFGPGDSVVAESGPASSMFPTSRNPSSSGSIDLPFSSPTPSSGDFDLPASVGPLRDTLDLPLLSDPSPKSSTSQAKAAPTPADVLALFQDEPKSNRKPKGAEARSKARRCPDCGGVVAIGMSLCNTCGLDLDTGQRIAPLDIIDDEMPVAARPASPPLGIMFVGSLCIMINVLLSIASLIWWQQGQGMGVLMLLVVWIFGIYASTQFLRRKTIRPLFLSLGLGVSIGVVALIALPIWEANVGSDAVVPNSDPDTPVIRNQAELLDIKKITWGIALLLSYAALSVYLNTPAMKRQFKK